MTGNQDIGGLTVRSIDAIDVMLAEAVKRAAARDVVDETTHLRGLTLLTLACGQPDAQAKGCVAGSQIFVAV